MSIRYVSGKGRSIKLFNIWEFTESSFADIVLRPWAKQNSVRPCTFLATLLNNKMQTDRKTKYIPSPAHLIAALGLNNRVLVSLGLTLSSQVYLTGFRLALAQQLSERMSKASTRWLCLSWHVILSPLKGATWVNCSECSSALMQGSPEFPAPFEHDGTQAQRINQQVVLPVGLLSSP